MLEGGVAGTSREEENCPGVDGYMGASLLQCNRVR